MKYCLVIHDAPYTSQASLSACRFAEQVLAEGHEIMRLFFFQNGVHNATALSVPPQDELDLTARWRTLVEAHNIDAVVCVASALKRGILDQGEAERYEKPGANLFPPFVIGGLGQLVEASLKADRVMCFGA